MKFIFKNLLIISIFLSAQSNANLLPSDFGNMVIDNLMASTTLSNSGDDNEVNWIRDTLDDQSITLTSKYDSDGGDWLLVPQESTIFYTELASSPSYFLLKFGTGKTGADSHYLFNNLGNLKYAVIDFSELSINLPSKTKFSIQKISHIGEVKSSSIKVPEPTNTMLMSLALILLSTRLYFCKR